MITSEEIKEIIEQYEFSFDDERGLQDEIEEILKNNGIFYSREHKLDDESRIDFFIGGVGVNIGIEVKLKQPQSQIIFQLHRYAQKKKIRELILITPSRKSMPTEISGKKITVAHVNRSGGI